MTNREVLYKFAFVDGITRPFYAWNITDEEKRRYQNDFYRTINGVKINMVHVKLRNGTEFFRINPKRTYPLDTRSGGSKETELHEAAKDIFLEKLENFTINIKKTVKCPACDGCSDYNQERCNFITKDFRFKLIDKYGESPVKEPRAVNGGYSPDILLKNSNGEEFWVEINTTHKVDSEKVWHGTPILEIDIAYEEDIEWLYKHRNFYEGNKTHYYNMWAMPLLKGYYCNELLSKFDNIRKQYMAGNLGLGIKGPWPFDKHLGETVMSVFQNDRGYFDWCMVNTKLPYQLSKNCKKTLGVD